MSALIANLPLTGHDPTDAVVGKIPGLYGSNRLERTRRKRASIRRASNHEAVFRDITPTLDGVIDDAFWEGIDGSDVFVERKPWLRMKPLVRIMAKSLHA